MSRTILLPLGYFAEEIHGSAGRNFTIYAPERRGVAGTLDRRAVEAWFQGATQAEHPSDTEAAEIIRVAARRIEQIDMPEAGRTSRISGSHQPHRFRPHEKYPSCAICGYAASERLMHPAREAADPSSLEEDEP